MSDPQTPDLPPGYALIADLRRRPGLRVVRARRGAEEVVLRLESGAGGESEAELAVLAALEAPGIARLADHGRLAGGGRYVARRWIDGLDLAAWSAGRSPEEIGRAAAVVAEELDRLHRLGFVHGDLKPENVIVGPAGPVLCDFGLARRTGGPAPEEIDGTPYSIAPEVLLGAAPAPPSDLFALGALLHRLLTGERASARHFYARFPKRSFFDAAGSSPERLPSWARDLVAELVSRDPARRPSSAAAVARALRARLGGAHPDRREREPDAPRLSLELGRERWLGDWLAELRDERAGPARPHLWVRVPEGEPPAAVADALRLFAALRGLETGRMALCEEVERCAGTVALDRWAERASGSHAGALVVPVDSPSPWATHGLEVLVRALRQRPGERAAHLVCVAAGPPPASAATAFAERAFPALLEERLAAFLARHLPREQPERRAAFARVLHALAAGAASRADALLRRAAAEGWLLPEGEDAWRLRPGALPEAADLALGLDAGVVAALPEEERLVLAALHVAGGRLAGPELEALELHRDPRGILALARRGLVAWQPARDGQELVLRARLLEPLALGARRLAERHARRAAALAARGAERWRVLAHGLGAGLARGAELALELEDLLARGAAELVLAAVERVEEVGRDTGRDLLAEEPRLALARVRAWSALGRPERAAETLARLESLPGAAGLALLGRAHLAVQRRMPEEALELCRRAAAADPALGAETRLLRVQVLHELGRDEETLALAAATDDASPRSRAYLESVAAVSAFRLGRAEEARARLAAVLAGAVSAGDAALEGAVRIDLAIVARRTGDLDGAIAGLEAAASAYERVGHAAGLAHARATQGGVLREAGRMLAAEPPLAEAAALRERLGDERGATTVRGTHGLLLAERGHLRGAIEELERAAARMEGAQQIRFAPLLRARADEARARLGLPPAGDAPPEPDAPDPRALLARARAAWMRRERQAALASARRAAELARRLGLEPVAAEAAGVVAALDPAAGKAPPAAEGTLAAEDQGILALLAAAPGPFDAGAARALAGELEARGRDDRAARLWLALAARGRPEAAGEAHAAAERCLARTNAGLTDEEARCLRHHLLGIPDPWPGDLNPRPTASDEDWDMEIVSLLEINRRMVEQGDLSSLLGEIVDAALKVTGAERGFLVLAEDGKISFDTALDSRRGDIAQPDFEVSSSILHEALQRMEPLRLSNAVDDPLLGHTPSVVSLELRSILCVPFRVDAALSGAIYVDHRLRTGAFGDKAERLCALLADQAALAIRQMRRLDEIRELYRRLERRVVTQEEGLAAARRALRAAGVSPATERLIGTSKAMEDVRALIDRAAGSAMAVLVTGESGTGKELAARALHEASPRAHGPFVSESCAALPPTLIESELFGYRRGAFTGAEEDHAGLFERADGGTLFLDEIGEMPLELQAKLLRVLETGEVRRLGDSAARKVDFRLVAATNRDPAREVREDRFREDLYYRLDGLRIALPALDERREDVPVLVEHFLRAEEARGGAPRRVSRAVLERLARRAWPGNVRELRNEVARLCVLAEGDLDDPELVREPDLATRRPPEPGAAPRTLADIERQAIEDALASTGGDKRKAADLLGISRAKIYQRLKEWKGEEPE